jgi:carbonic anhydrase
MPATPLKRLAVVACMDARLNPYEILDLSVGEAHILRNAGGVVTEDTIRSLAISQRVLGTEQIVVLQHTDCGLAGFDDDGFRHRLRDECGVEPTWADESFADSEEGVLRAIARIGASPFIEATGGVRGFVYDVETGELREVRVP